MYTRWRLHHSSCSGNRAVHCSSLRDVPPRPSSALASAPLETSTATLNKRPQSAWAMSISARLYRTPGLNAASVALKMRRSSDGSHSAIEKVAKANSPVAKSTACRIAPLAPAKDPASPTACATAVRRERGFVTFTLSLWRTPELNMWTVPVSDVHAIRFPAGLKHTFSTLFVVAPRLNCRRTFPVRVSESLSAVPRMEAVTACVPSWVSATTARVWSCGVQCTCRHDSVRAIAAARARWDADGAGCRALVTVALAGRTTGSVYVKKTSRPSVGPENAIFTSPDVSSA
mmetsp:Transcript_26590/g.82214  ORF Transcript_26590/g.82214 Transcript_26590/m.82214 type:complete len:288 (-) Transcript_26590:706-1569(-)